MNTISVELLRTWLEEGRPVTVLDVRPSDQRAEWAIPGSLHLDAYRALNEHDPRTPQDLCADDALPHSAHTTQLPTNRHVQ